MIALVAAAAMALQQPPLSLRLAFVGRDAVFVDTASVVREGETRTFRILRIVDGDGAINGERFLGGWQTVGLDCKARMFRPLTFASIRESGAVGPESALKGQDYPIAGGSAEAGLEAAVCEGRFKSNDAPASLAEAARIGRQRIEDETDALLNRR